MSPLSPPRFSVPGERSEGGGCPHRGKLYLSSVQAMFLLGSGENVFDIGAVLSCLPAVNDDVSALAKKANIEHHAYFLLDDNDALSVRLGDGSPTSSPRSSAKRGSVTSPAAAESDNNHHEEDIFRKFQDGPALRNALQFIHSHRLAKRNVLVHCDGGVLRSPATVISYLMAFTRRSMSEASAIVKRCRSVVHVRLLEDSLQAFENSLHNSSANSHQSVNLGDRSTFEISGASTMRVPESACVILDPVRSSARGRTCSESRFSPRLCVTHTSNGPLDDSSGGDGDFHSHHSEETSERTDTDILHRFPVSTTTTTVTVTPFATAQKMVSASVSSRNVLSGALATTISNTNPVSTIPMNKPFLSVRID
jgi:hypothetical protein